MSGYGRGQFAWHGIELAAIGHVVYAVDSAGVMTQALAWALDDGKPVTICGCPQTAVYPQYLVTSGGEASLIYELGPGRWLGGMPGTITSMVGKATMGDFLDGRFLILDANTSTLYISAVFNGASWSPGTDFAQRSLAPDPWKAMKVVGRYIWLFGEQTTEIWFHEVRPGNHPVWLLREVKVHLKRAGWTFENTHRYSDYHLFSVGTREERKTPTERPKPPERPLDGITGLDRMTGSARLAGAPQSWARQTYGLWIP